MKNQWLMIKQLDRDLKEWQQLRERYGRPKAGWVKTLRVALGMSVEQLANRLNVKRARISQLEQGEAHDTITLRTLKAAADALECELIYAIVPKGNSSLEKIIKERAEQIAIEQINNVAHSMSLESQSIDDDALKLQKNFLVADLTTNLNKKLWTCFKRSNNSNDLRKQLEKNLKKKK